MKRFKSKVSNVNILLNVIWFSTVTINFIINKFWYGLPIVLIIAIFQSQILYVRYIIDNNILSIYSNRYTKTNIPITNIIKIKPTFDSRRAPALSMDRLSIRYTIDGKKKEVLVSPKNKEEFMQALKEINGDIEFGRSYKILN